LADDRRRCRRRLDLRLRDDALLRPQGAPPADAATDDALYAAPGRSTPYATAASLIALRKHGCTTERRSVTVDPVPKPPSLIRPVLSRLSHPISGLKNSRRVRALRLLASVSPALMGTVAAFVVAESILPNLTLIAMGRATGRIPAAARDGLSSAAGHALLISLAVAGVCYSLSLLRGPAE